MVNVKAVGRRSGLNVGSIRPIESDHNALRHYDDAGCNGHGFLAPAVRSGTFWDPELMADRTFGAAAQGCGTPVFLRMASDTSALDG